MLVIIFYVLQTLRFGTRRRIQGLAKLVTWNNFEKVAKVFQPGFVFVNCSVLDWRDSKYTFGYTKFSLERPWLFVLVFLTAHPHTGGVISFDFFGVFSRDHFWYTAYSATRLGERVTHHNLCLSNVWC